MVLSGSTGKLIGRKLATPDGRESYSLATVYTFPDGSQYIFFGTGGETVSGIMKGLVHKFEIQVQRAGQKI